MAQILKQYAVANGWCVLLDVGGRPSTTYFQAEPTASDLAERLDDIDRRMLDEITAEKFNEHEES